MTTRLAALEDARTARNAARGALDGHIARIRTDADQRGIGGRITDEATEKVLDALDEAIAVAEDNKAVIAGTLSALALWFLRHPIMSLISRLLGTNAPEDEETSDD